VGRVADWLFGAVDTDRPAAAVSAAAGQVALTRTQPSARLPWSRGGENLLPVEWATIAGDAWGREAAMSIPTISRARDLICSAVGALPFTLWRVDFAAVPPVEESLPPAPWMARPDPDRTRQWILAWTTDDLYFYGVSHWLITGRYAAPMDYPATFARIMPGDLHVDASTGRTTVNGEGVDPRDVVEFLSPIEGLLANGWRGISIALQLDEAADRFAATELPTGVLEEQEGGEDLTAEELAEEAAKFTEARRLNTTASVNKYLRYREINANPDAMQLVQSRSYQALELARLGNVPPYLVGAPTGTGMTYQNAVQARGDLIDFGALPYIGCIEQTLGGPNVVPRGQAVRLDTNAWLRNPFLTEDTTAESPTDLEQAYNPAAAPTMEAPA
jgi:Phage portal protein